MIDKELKLNNIIWKKNGLNIINYLQEALNQWNLIIYMEYILTT